MKIPRELISNFITSEFKENRLTTTGEFQINSFYTDDKKRKLYINAESGVYICFKTGEKGSFLKLVRDYMGLNSINEAIQYLVSNYSFKFEEKELPKEEIDNIKAVNDFLSKDNPVFFKNPDSLGIFGKKAYKYLLDRKLEEEYYPKLGYVFNEHSRYSGRVIIPFFEFEKMNYFLARSINKNDPIRYLNPSGVNSKGVLFNIDNINEEVVICEGSFDAMSITVDQPTTCLLSADIGVGQLNKLFEKKVKKIIYVPDNDETGHKQMDKNIKKIISYCPYTGLDIYTFNLPSDCKDLNDMKIKYNKNYILKKECEKYGRNLFARSIW